MPSSHPGNSGRGPLRAAAVACLALACGTGPLRAHLAEEIRVALREPLEARLERLAEEKKRGGAPLPAGRLLRSFRPGGRGHLPRDVPPGHGAAGQAADRAPFAAPAARPGDREWRIAQETVEDTREEVFRAVPGDERFYRFDRFHFADEGFEVVVQDGTLVVDFLAGGNRCC